MPLTLCRTCWRVKASIDTRVPISGVKPGLGPTTQDSSSWAAAGSGARARPEKPAARAAPAFRKVRRLGRHSDENIRALLWRLVQVDESYCAGGLERSAKPGDEERD